MRQFHDRAMQSLCDDLGVDTSDGEVRFKWVSLAVADLTQQLATAQATIAWHDKRDQAQEDERDQLQATITAAQAEIARLRFTLNVIATAETKQGGQYIAESGAVLQRIAINALNPQEPT